MAFDTPWQILDQNRLNIPGLMQAAGEAKTRRLQEMMLNRQMEREDKQYEREDRLLGVYAKLKQPQSKGGGPASGGVGGGEGTPPRPSNIPSGSPMGAQAGQMGGGPEAQQAPPEAVQSWVDANREVVGELLAIDPGKAFALTQQLANLDEVGRARVKEMNELRGRVALTLANVPQAQRGQALASLMPRLREMGITPDIVRQELGDLSDMSLQMAASLSMDVAALTKAQEEYTLQPGAARYRGGQMIAERPFAPKTLTVGEGDTIVEYQPGGGDIFSRMIQAESGGQQFAKDGSPLASPAGAIGIAQVMPGTAPEAAALAGLPWDEQRYRSDPDYNAAIGKAYFEKQLETFRDPALAVAAYNAGPGAVQNAVEKAGDNWLGALPAETQNYVSKVMGGSRVIAQGPKKQKKEASILSAEEAKGLGLPAAGNIVYQRMPNGEIKPVSGQDTKAAANKEAYSQSALDAFDRAIATAQRLAQHPGLKDAVGVKGLSGGLIGGWVVPGTDAADFMAELDAMKAQVFLPMVQSMKGMGALSNAEGQKLTDAIGALDTKMSEGQFKASLKRIYRDLNTYKSRASNKEKKAPQGANGDVEDILRRYGVMK